MFSFIEYFYPPYLVLIFIFFTFISLFIKDIKVFFKVNFFLNSLFGLIIIGLGAYLYWDYTGIYAVGLQSWMGEFFFRDSLRLIYIGVYLLLNLLVIYYKIIKFKK